MPIFLLPAQWPTLPDGIWVHGLDAGVCDLSAAKIKLAKQLIAEFGSRDGKDGESGSG